MLNKDSVGYDSAGVPPSRFPDRKFCAVCGYPFKTTKHNHSHTLHSFNKFFFFTDFGNFTDAQHPYMFDVKIVFMFFKKKHFLML